METIWQGGDESQNEGAEATNVVSIEGRLRPAVRPEPFLTDAERREIREMLAYYRVARPQFEAIKQSCPTARFLLGDD